MIDLYLSLGSNMGNRNANICKALGLMDIAFGRPYTSLSEIIETEAWGFESDPFLNCAVLYRLPRKRQSAESQALEILYVIKDIERRMGREETIEYNEDGNRIYHPRTMDIDILFFGGHKINLPELVIPHPLIKERDFVKTPLSQIAKKALKLSFGDYFQIKNLF